MVNLLNISNQIQAIDTLAPAVVFFAQGAVVEFVYAM